MIFEEAFKTLIRIIRPRNYLIDQMAFRLHCTYTSMLLLLFCTIITTKQIAGDPIDCDHNSYAVKPTVLNNYCYIQTTYTITNAFDKKLGSQIPHPGVFINSDRYDENEHIYYQWVWFILFFQAFCFYCPRWLWKGWENGKIKHLVADFNQFVNEENRNNKNKLIVNHMVENRENNDNYAEKYLICLILAFCNVLGQMFFINFFLNGEFYTYGFDVIKFIYTDPQLRSDPMVKIFPRMTKCIYRKFGPSGNIQTIDALCLLPVNMYNEKIFIFLWFWFFMLLITIAISIICKLILIFSPIARFYYIRREFQMKYLWNRRDSNRFDGENFKYGELFVLLLIKQNTGLQFSKEVLSHLIDRYQSIESERTELIKSTDQKIDKKDKLSLE